MEDNDLLKEFEKLSPEEQRQLIDAFESEEKGSESYRALQKILFRSQPPSPQQFLDPVNGWISSDLANSIHPHVKKDFLEITSGKINYDTICLYGSTRCHGKGTKIRMYDMTVKLIEDIKTGDMVMGDDGSPRKVLNTTNGFDDLYIVHQNKAESYTATGDHILVLYNQKNNTIQEISVNEFIMLDDREKDLLKGIKFSPESVQSDIHVVPARKDEFYGISVDGNNRYCLGDLTITHNSGKTFTARLLIIYTIIYYHYLRKPFLHYNLSPSSTPTIFIASFDFDIIYQVYLEPILKFLESSPRFHCVKFKDSVVATQAQMGDEIIVYSKATTADHAHLTLASGLALVSGNDEQIKLLGKDAIQVYISEIAYFIESAGASEDSIFDFYVKASNRVKNTVGRNEFLAFTYLDTSARYAESIIENHMIKNLSKEKSCFFRWRSLWEARPNLFPLWQESGETFKVCTGDGTYPSMIISHPSQLSGIPHHLIIDVPVDVKKEFEEHLVENIRDTAGRPTSSESKFFQQRIFIDQIFDQNIDNIEGILIADSADDPDKLLWNQISERFFTKYDGINYIIKRAPRESRFIAVDTAHSVRGDVVGFTMLHKEISSDGKVFYVCDLCFAIGPGNNGINLEAIQYLIRDIAGTGNVPIHQVNVDKFQSENMVQYLNRLNIRAVKTSVDEQIQPYMFLYSSILDGRVKAGRNVFLKNNLDSLYRVKTKSKKEKIDHSAGKTNNSYFGKFEDSTCGINAKDVSDSLAQAVFAMNEVNYMPVTVYEKQNIRLEEKKKGQVSLADENFRNRVKEATLMLRGKY